MKVRMPQPYAHLLFGRPEKYFPVKFIFPEKVVVVIRAINKGLLYKSYRKNRILNE